MAYKEGAREQMAKRLGITWVAPDRVHDIYSGEPWSEMAIEDLQAQWRTGADLEELSSYLCRDWEEVAQKCAELDLDLVYQPQRRRGFLAKRPSKTAEKDSSGEL
jgi:hypothetical protein